MNNFEHKVTIEICDSVRHTAKWSHSIEQYEIYFKHQNDAVAFKLRWM